MLILVAAMVGGRETSASGDEGSTPNDPNKSEQEKKTRIRDNQRRSRARRQEHLLDLEKRLTESHAALRQADFQRNALRDLQVENGRLRELLRVAGINEALTDSYVNQGIAQSMDPSTSLRQIRPRIPTHQEESRHGQAGNSSPYSDTSSLGHVRSNVEPVSTTYAQAPYMHAQNIPAMQQLQLPDIFSDRQRPRQQQLSIFQNSPQPEETFHCDIFGCAPTGPLLENSDNTILCSEAKAILDQYIIDPLDVPFVKARLATGFCKPAIAGQGCRVDNRLLFQVLNEINPALP